MIDTHCHLNFEAYDADREQVVERAEQAGVLQIINPGIDLESSRTGIELARQFQSVFTAVGIHPNSSASFSGDEVGALEQLAASDKVVAIGEIGLDYYWDKSPKSKQLSAFEAQLSLAAELNLPVIIHNREASEDVIRILEQWSTGLPPTLAEHPGVLHSFSASPDIAERALAAGFYLGFTGPITFEKADELRAVARQAPLERILVETDGPFLTPVPHRGKRNEPAYIPYIVDRLAALKQLPTEEMSRITTENAVRLFRLPPP
ncbi:MAG TPA: TatD family hydrolase [Spirillospora sp.]|nr:TatD family hydrolase [Spirillospora sp.]